MRAAARPRRRPVDPAAQRDLRTTAVVHERFDTERVLRALREQRDHARQPRRDDARAPARRGPASIRRRCAARSPAAGRCRPALLARAREAGVPVELDLRPDRGLLAGARRTPLAATRPARERRAARAGPPLFCTRVRDRAPTARSSSRGPTVAPGVARRATAGCTPAISARSTSDGRLRVERPQGRHDRQRRRERRAGGGRGGARERTRRCSRRPCSAAPTSAGARPSRAIVVPRAGRAAAGGGAARALRRALAAVQGAQADRARRRAAAAHALGQAAAQGAAMSFDPERLPRRPACENWEEAASGWVAPARRSARRFGAPVSHWMIDAVVPAARPARARARGRPGRDRPARGRAGRPHRRRDHLRPGRGDARGRARAGRRARASTNVEFQVLNAEWIDLPLASVDAVLCRWGYMLMADPRGGAARDAARAAPGRARSRWRCGTRSSTTRGRTLPALGAARARARAAPARRRASAGPVRARRRRARARAARGAPASPRSSIEALDLARRHATSRSSGRPRSTSRAASTTPCSPPRGRDRRDPARPRGAPRALHRAPTARSRSPGRTLVAARERVSRSIACAP